MTEVTEPKSKTPTKQERKPPRVETSFDGEKTIAVRVTGDVARLFDATGGETMTTTFVEQIANLTLKGERFDDNATNFVLGFVDTMHPNDPVEAMLLTQMAATHQATMMMARRLNLVDQIPQVDSTERALNKLMRTYTAQMEALRKYRNGGNQTVTVQHVNVQDGGQAIVGNVKTGGRGA